ncbi:MAG: T9SS type B sorting domain-containing protein, partial [Sphingobacteriales bacterium]
DDCGTPLAVAQEILFTVSAIQPTPMDSLAMVTCSPVELKLVFKNNIRCNTIATNGSDFVLSGPTGSRISSAATSCDATGFTKAITLRLNTPIQTDGNYRINLVNGSDLNTIIDECGQSTPAGSSISFSVRDTVSAAFTYRVAPGCITDTISFAHDGRNGVNTWRWAMDDNKISGLQSPEAYYTRFGEKRISLIVSNGFCADTTEQQIMLDNGIEAKFTAPIIICPAEPASFVDASTGAISSWQWNFGNGFASNTPTPTPQSYQLPPNTRELRYNVSLVIGNLIGCFDTAVVSVRAVSSCYIAVPGAFTPNNDGLNDYLYPLNAFKATDLSFRVFNRYGQMVFSTADWNEKWDGTIKGKAQAAGTYVWTLSYT